MELPNREQAFVQPTKLAGYLLSETHSVGRSKAKFFRDLGFNEDTVSLPEQELLAIARSQKVTKTMSTVHGMRYVIVGKISTPTNTMVSVLTVWIIDAGERFPRFVTARPFLAQSEGGEDD